jgi:hypothetical protein
MICLLPRGNAPNGIRGCITPQQLREASRVRCARTFDQIADRHDRETRDLIL